MRRFLKICSQDAPEADLESSYDITPIFSAPNPREYYGKDFEGEKNGNKFINNDTGTESEDKYYGNRLLKKQALEKLIKEYNIPVNKYNHLIYVVPGNKENPPSDQLYPCSYSGKPWNIKVISGTDTLTGSLHCGIMQPLGAQVGTFAHEFGHQLGLPDLYPYSNIPNRDLGYSGLMASGSHYNTSFTGMSKLKKYDESYFKKNWLEESRIIYAEKEGTYTLHARDSKNSPNMIYINLSNTFEPNDCFIIEVFDRQDIDKNTAAYLSGNQGTGKANAGVFIYYMDDIDVEDIKFLNTLPASEKAWNRVFLPGGEYSDYGVTISVESLTLNNEHYTANIKISFTEKAEKGKSSSISDSDYDKGSNNFKADNKTSNEKAELIKKKIDISRLDLSGRLKKSLDQMIKGVAIIIRKGKEKISDIKTKEK
jgi:M6 family metalloprotease-like protein